MENPPQNRAFPKRYSEDSLEAVVVELVVTGEGDQTAPGRTKSKEDLHRCCHPGLLHTHTCNAVIHYCLRQGLEPFRTNDTTIHQCSRWHREAESSALLPLLTCHTHTYNNTSLSTSRLIGVKETCTACQDNNSNDSGGTHASQTHTQQTVHNCLRKDS